MSRTTSALPPSVRTRQQTAQKIKNQLALIEERREDDLLMQVSNGHDDGARALGPEGQPMLKTDDKNEIVYEDDKPVYLTYGEIKQQHADAIERIWAHANDLDVAALITKMVEAEHAAEHAVEASD